MVIWHKQRRHWTQLIKYRRIWKVTSMRIGNGFLLTKLTLYAKSMWLHIFKYLGHLKMSSIRYWMRLRMPGEPDLYCNIFIMCSCSERIEIFLSTFFPFLLALLLSIFLPFLTIPAMSSFSFAILLEIGSFLATIFLATIVWLLGKVLIDLPFLVVPDCFILESEILISFGGFDLHYTSKEFGFIEIVDSCLSVLIIFILNEGESSRAAYLISLYSITCIVIKGDLNWFHFTKCYEDILQLVTGSLLRDSA